MARLTRGSEVVAAIDVVPGQVGIALMEKSPRGPARIIASARTLLAIGDEGNEHSLATIGQGIGEVAAQIQNMLKDSPPTVQEVHVLVHAPWAKSVVYTVETKWDFDRLVDASAMSELAHKALQEQKTVRADSVMEAAVVRSCVNGYPTRKPEGKLGRSLLATSVLSELDASAHTAIEAAIHKAYPIAKITWRSFLRSALALRERGHDFGDSFLVIDVGLETTQIVSVRDDVIVEEKQVQEGTRSILKRIGNIEKPAKKKTPTRTDESPTEKDETSPSKKIKPAGDAPDGRHPEEVLTHIRMLGRDACEGVACEAIRDSLNSMLPELVKAYGEALTALAHEHRVGNDVVLVAHPDMVEWFSQFFSRIDFAQFTITMQPLSVVPLDRDHLREWVESDRELDSGLMLTASIVNIEANA